jgi:ubiquinone biosynthesis protein UbiJ
MPTQEDRLSTLERKVAALELERLYEQRKAEESTPSKQAYNANEINQNLTILLGVAAGQEKDIKAIKENVSSIKDRLESVEQRLGRLETRFEEHTALLTQILARLS